tara:strand:- start:198 stop:476 length:279 start_codon:yes stop_codon:yes gene_type:complete
MENTTKTEISNIREYTDIALNAIDKIVNSHLSMIGYGNREPLKKIDELPTWSMDAEKLVEIYNFAKAKEVIKDNRQAMIRELNERAEESDSE